MVGKTPYVSGQIPFNPKTMLLVSEDIKDQTKQWLENILGIGLEAGMKKEVWEENWGLGDYENK